VVLLDDQECYLYCLIRRIVHYLMWTSSTVLHFVKSWRKSGVGRIVPGKTVRASGQSFINEA